MCVFGQQAAESKEQNGYDELFDEDEGGDGGGLLDECRRVSGGEEDDDDPMPATRKPRNRGNALMFDDENSQGAAPPSDLIRLCNCN